ncbi:VOC family protein [Sporosarcina oncorhynchi]|uniref:VOC family protein n=1 Tax=Sporosarcina oncorhynchi TaxID=3056444 RepID=UPI00295E4918|nr:VOC family protein [Sporosarcina sp. T2O-4]
MIRRIDHVGVIVNDLAAAKDFFLNLGLDVLGEAEVDVEVEWIEREMGLTDFRKMIVMLGTQDGETTLELVKFHTLSDEKEFQQHFPTTLGVSHIAFAVENIEVVVAKLKKSGAELLGEIKTYENIIKLCYVRGPEGIVLELAEKIS